MALVRYAHRTPLPMWRDLEEPFGRLARLFDDPRLAPGTEGIWNPPVTVTETDDALVFTVELPGLTEQSIDIALENHVLSISGEKADAREEGGDDEKYHLWERRYGSFKRSFKLPSDVNEDETKAVFENGVLTVTLPKAAEAKGKRIEISKS